MTRNIKMVCVRAVTPPNVSKIRLCNVILWKQISPCIRDGRKDVLWRIAASLSRASFMNMCACSSTSRLIPSIQTSVRCLTHVALHCLRLRMHRPHKIQERHRRYRSRTRSESLGVVFTLAQRWPLSVLCWKRKIRTKKKVPS